MSSMGGTYSRWRWTLFALIVTAAIAACQNGVDGS